jgi:methyl-accepting chemotaxis protein
MNNMQLGRRLALGFGVVLMLTVVVTVAGFLSLQRVTESAAIVSIMDGLVSQLMEARREEKNFQLRGFAVWEGDTQNAVQKLDDIVVQIRWGIAAASDAATSVEDRASLARMLDQVELYRSAFETYVALEQTKLTADEQLVASGQRALDAVEQMQADQHEKIHAAIEAKANAATILDRVETADDAAHLTGWMLDLRRLEKDYMLHHGAQSVGEIETLTSTMTAMLESLRGRFQDSVNIAQVQAIAAALDDYHAAFDAYVEARNAQQEQENQMVEAARQAEQAAEEVRDAQIRAMDAARRAATLTMAIAALAAVALGVVAAVFITRSISGPVKQLIRASEKIAEGDVEVQIAIDQRDELGQLARVFRGMVDYLQAMVSAAERIAEGDLSIRVRPRSTEDALGSAFATMTSNLHDLIAQVQDNALQVASAAQQINAASEQTAQASQQVADTIQQVAQGTAQQSQAVTEATAQVDQMAQAIDGVAKGAQEQARAIERASASAAQMSTAIEQVAASAQEGARASNEASTNARRGADTVSQTMEAMATIKSTVTDVGTKVQQMQQHSEEIGAIVETIDDIAEQTNLLALNAAIEAARAGEQGRGFAVVADEVRKLAERSSLATKEIAVLIRSVQTGIEEAVGAMDRSLQEVESGAELATISGAALDDILSASQHVYDQVQQIASAAQEMTAASSELVSAMDSVSAVVEENTAATEESAASTGEISAAMEHVASVSEENSAAAEEVSAMTEELNAQAEELTASAQSLAAMSEDLQHLVARFRLEDDGAEDGHTRSAERIALQGSAPAPHQEPVPVHGELVATAEGNGRH